MISDRGIARWRLRSQRLTQAHAGSALDAVGEPARGPGENQDPSAWTGAARTSDPSRDPIREALDDGRLIRTHVLRPTWHYVLGVAKHEVSFVGPD